jgi:hypothetical protein
VQGDGVGERLPDRQSGGEYGTVAATGRALVVVPVLFRHRTRRAGYDRYRRDFTKLIWHTASPKWNFDDETFERSAASFDNVDHVDIVIHNYRWRLGLTPGESQYDDLEKQLATSPVITVPTITLEGDANGAPHPDPSAYATKFSGKYTHRTISGGVGHNLPQEVPERSSKPSWTSTNSRPNHQSWRPLAGSRRTYMRDGCQADQRSEPGARRHGCA